MSGGSVRLHDGFVCVELQRRVCHRVLLSIGIRDGSGGGMSCGQVRRSVRSGYEWVLGRLLGGVMVSGRIDELDVSRLRCWPLWCEYRPVIICVQRILLSRLLLCRELYDSNCCIVSRRQVLCDNRRICAFRLRRVSSRQVRCPRSADNGCLLRTMLHWLLLRAWVAIGHGGTVSARQVRRYSWPGSCSMQWRLSQGVLLWRWHYVCNADAMSRRYLWRLVGLDWSCL